MREVVWCREDMGKLRCDVRAFAVPVLKEFRG